MKIMTQTYAILSIGFGLLIIIFPELLAWLVGLFFIISGAMALAE